MSFVMPAPPKQKPRWDYESTVPVALAQYVTFTHNLGKKPTDYTIYAVCKAGSGGFVVGDVIDLNSFVQQVELYDSTAKIRGINLSLKQKNSNGNYFTLSGSNFNIFLKANL